MRPWFLAPPITVRRGLDGDELVLHTVQTKAAYDVLCATGVLAGDPALEDEYFTEAYAWMRRQMDARLGPGVGMIWLWAKDTRRELARSCRRSRGQVLLTVRMSRGQVLLSDFGAWHTVLNRTLEVPLVPGETLEDCEPRFDRIHDDWTDRSRAYDEVPLERWPPALRDELEASWTAIFELADRPEPLYVQATVNEVRTADVLRAVRIW